MSDDKPDWPDVALQIIVLLVVLCIVGLMAAGVFYAWKAALRG